MKKIFFVLGFLSLFVFLAGVSFTKAADATSSISVTSAPIITPNYFFKYDLKKGDTHADVKELQKYLNTHGFPVSVSGVGSFGNETTYFGELTKASLIKFQEANANMILVPQNLTHGTGNFYLFTRDFINQNTMSKKKDTFSLKYDAGDYGTITGKKEQTVKEGGDGEKVTVEPGKGYTFAGWSDSIFDNPRIDKNVGADVDVKAKYNKITYSGKGVPKTASVQNIQVSYALCVGDTEECSAFSNITTGSHIDVGKAHQILFKLSNTGGKALSIGVGATDPVVLSDVGPESYFTSQVVIDPMPTFPVAAKNDTRFRVYATTNGGWDRVHVGQVDIYTDDPDTADFSVIVDSHC